MASTPHLRRPDADHVRRKWDTISENELRLPDKAASQIIAALNDDLSGLYILFNQVRKHYWTLKAVESNEVGDFLETTADRLTEMTDTLAIRVHAVGGVPVCGPMGIRQHAPVYIEQPHRYDIRSSLNRDLDGYATLAVQIRDHIERVEQLGDTATGELLRRYLKLLEEDAHILERYLANDTLVQQKK